MRSRLAAMLVPPLLLAACGTNVPESVGGSGGAGTTSSTTGSGGAAPVPCGSDSGAALAACVEEDRYANDLATVALPRPPGSQAWQDVRDLCASRFAALGYQVELHQYATGVNVIGTLPGADLAAEQVIVSAHYDSVPNCPGADDNGSGVAGVLEAARVLAKGEYRRTLVVACWDEEEDGLVGSRAYAQRAKSDGDTIVGAFVFEMIGYRSSMPGSQTLPPGFPVIFPEAAAQVTDNESRGDFIAVIGDSSMAGPQGAYLAAADALGLRALSLSLAQDQKNSALFADLRRSDHASFWEVDYPALMLTDTANFRNSHYHCTSGPDAVSDLDTSFAAAVVSATVWAAAETLKLP